MAMKPMTLSCCSVSTMRVRLFFGELGRRDAHAIKLAAARSADDAQLVGLQEPGDSGGRGLRLEADEDVRAVAGNARRRRGGLIAARTFFLEHETGQQSGLQRDGERRRRCRPRQRARRKACQKLGEACAKIDRRARPARRQRADPGEQRCDIAGRRLARRRADRGFLGEFRPHPIVATGKLRIIGQRSLDLPHLVLLQRSRGVPGQQQLDLARFALARRIVRRSHGQPRSMPCSLRSSDNFLRA